MSSQRHDPFRDPAIQYRPRFRYWIPDAHVNTSRVAGDIAEAGARGAAGVELLGFYMYGATAGDNIPVDWNEYGWGTPAWKMVLDAAIQAHLDNGLCMDFAMGPNQGQGVPAEEDNEGLMWDLSPHFERVPFGGAFNGTIPGWGTGSLEAVITGLVTESVESGLFQRRDVLSESSLQDVTANVSADGWLDVDFATSASGVDHIVFAVYLVRSGARNQMPPGQLAGLQTTPTDYVHNGSWIVDHFSARGAQVLTGFWDEHLLTNGTRESLLQVAGFAWEDSIEINPNIYWTPNLPRDFAQRRGYSVSRYYPILFHDNSLMDHMNTKFVTDELDRGNSHVDDYRATLTEGYMEYLTELRQWANDLGVRWSSQIGYNMAVDMQAAILVVDVPECEDLAFAGSIDGYRQFAAPANMAGQQIVSAEVGAVLGQAYQLKIPGLLRLIKRLFSGGVNAVVLHGLAYSGEYPNTTWPGFAAFTYAWSDMHGRHQPAWDFMRGPLDYLARNMFVLQSGVPKTDLAFYQKRTTYRAIPRNYAYDDLSAAGYTYSYINPDSLALPEATVENCVLAPTRQAYKALVVQSGDLMTIVGAEMIARAATAGLPVLFCGGMPSRLAGYDPDGSAKVNATLEAIRSLDNVHEVAEGPVAAVIDSLGIRPRVRIDATDISWWPVWRESAGSHERYIFLYNSGIDSEAPVEFQTTGTPFLYDAWSGDRRPILNYTQTATSTTIHVRLAAEQTTLIVFKDSTQSIHAVSTSPSVLRITTADSGRLVAHVASSDDSSDQWVATSDGLKHSVRSTKASEFSLQYWTLVVEHWDPPSPLTDAAAAADRYNTTHHLHALTSWQSIDGLQHVSGRGYYNTTFEWPLSDDSDATGAVLSFGSIDHTLAVTINGHALPPLDVTNATADITSLLVQGSNRVEAVVSTTLANTMAPIWDSLRSGGAPPTGLFGSDTTPPGNADYGLLQPVVVTPYRAVELGYEDEL